jgi:hypothetical protein
VIVDEGYLAFVRLRVCALCGQRPVDAHHVVNRGTHQHKRNDYLAAPLCREDHSLVHSVGLATALGQRGITVARLVETVATQLVEYFTIIKGTGVSLDPNIPF